MRERPACRGTVLDATILYRAALLYGIARPWRVRSRRCPGDGRDLALPPQIHRLAPHAALSLVSRGQPRRDALLPHPS
jgi:hypothetical protein